MIKRTPPEIKQALLCLAGIVLLINATAMILMRTKRMNNDMFSMVANKATSCGDAPIISAITAGSNVNPYLQKIINSRHGSSRMKYQIMKLPRFRIPCNIRMRESAKMKVWGM